MLAFRPLRSCSRNQRAGAVSRRNLYGVFTFAMLLLPFALAQPGMTVRYHIFPSTCPGACSVYADKEHPCVCCADDSPGSALDELVVVSRQSKKGRLIGRFCVLG